MNILCILFIDVSYNAHVRELVKNLSKNNFLHLFAFAKERNLKIENFHSMGSKGYLKRNAFQPFYMLYALIKAFIQSRKYAKDAQILYGRGGVETIVLSLFKKLYGKKIISEFNGIDADEWRLYKTFLTNIYAKIFEVLERCSVKVSDAFIVVTPNIKKYLQERYNISPEKITVIENGVNITLFRPINNEVKCGFDKNYNYVGFSGSFAQWHGLEDLVRSAPLILKEVENTKFLLVGDGVMKEQIIQMVNDLNLADNFIFINRVPYEEVPKYVNAFDVCVILKKEDIPGSPLKLWEYMACGKPVIATNTEDFRVLEEYNAGILVDPEKTEAVAGAIIKLLKDETLRMRMGENGRRVVVEKFSWERVAKDVAKVCEGFIGKNDRF